MQIRYEEMTDCGLQRQINQDCVGVFSQGDIGLFLIADGMGGYSDGEVASRMLVDEMGSWWEKNGSDCHNRDFQNVVEGIRQKILSINQKILELYNQNQICGSTLVLLLIVQNAYAVFSVGDSRIYTIKGRTLLQMTKDDVWENLNSTLERYSQEEICRHHNYGKLAQSVGSAEQIFINIQTGKCEHNQVFLLCSDGLYKVCHEDKIREALLNWKLQTCMGQCLTNLKNAAYTQNAPDNLSIILVSVKKDRFYDWVSKIPFFRK